VGGGRVFFVNRLRDIESISVEFDETTIQAGNSPFTPRSNFGARNPAKEVIRRKASMQDLVAAGEIGKGAISNQEDWAIQFLQAWASEVGKHRESDSCVQQPDIETEGTAQGIRGELCTSLNSAQSAQIFKIIYTVCFTLLPESLLPEWQGNDIDINQFKGWVIENLKSGPCNRNLENKISDHNPTSDLDCDQLKSERLRRNSIPYTIWNAVSSFKNIQGQQSWTVVKAVIEILESSCVNCPWMQGIERGVFGETPLHLALLCNERDNQDFIEMFMYLWKACPCLRELEYTSSLYEGENILHLAIVRGFSVKFLKRICNHQTDVWKTLVRSRAVGDFFVEQKYGIAPLGELPVFFAACLNRPDAFNFLAQQDQELLLETTESENNNLLHVLILKEAAGGLWTSSPAQSQSESLLSFKTMEAVYKILKGITMMPPGQGCSLMPGAGSAAGAGVAQITTVFETLMRGENAQGRTPLALAAASGSCKMFCHLFDTIAWAYGPVTCTKLYLEGVDVDIPASETNSKEADRPGRMAAGPASTQKSSILEILAEFNRSDILSNSCIDELVDIKWRKYGNFFFNRKLGFSMLIASLTFVLPMIQADTTVFWKIVYTLFHLVVAFCTHFEHRRGAERKSALFNLIFGFSEIKGYGQLILRFKDFLIELFCFIPVGALSMLEHLGVVMEGVRSCRKYFESIEGDAIETIIMSHRRTKSTLAPHNSAQNPAVDSKIWAGITQSAPPISFLLLCTFSLHAWVLVFLPPVYPPKDLVGEVPYRLVEAVAVSTHIVEISLYALLGLVAFWNFVSLVVAVDQEYGLYIQMLINITCQDLPVFFAVYALLLLAFSYCHFLASNRVFSGVGEAMDSICGIFFAMIGQFHKDTTKVAKDSPFQPVVTGISMASHFLVTVVLVNLLIAHISNTFKETSAVARGLRKLRRAKIMVEIDWTMPAEQRREKKYVYWNSGSDNRRSETFPRFEEALNLCSNKLTVAFNNRANNNSMVLAVVMLSS
jgi:hypothetical protein